MISFEHSLVIVSTLISFSGAYVYVHDTLRGTTKPNRVSYAMFALAPLIGTAAALSAHADLWVTVRTFIGGFVPLVVLIVSFINPNSYWKLTLFDFICGVFSVVALILWLVIDQPAIAVLFAALADGFATIPTIKKSWTNPETESGFSYLMYMLSTLIILPAIPVWNLQNSAFQIYLLMANIIILFAIYRKRIFSI